MKLRTRFVSNSSSASFVVDKMYLSEIQIDRILNHISFGRAQEFDIQGGDDGVPYFYYDEQDAWGVAERDGFVSLSTSMDNFDMEGFLLDVLEVDPKAFVENGH